ncbi:uncharacterized protein METZ01_LOCUS280478, partial [marine metagenome]
VVDPRLTSVERPRGRLEAIRQGVVELFGIG